MITCPNCHVLLPWPKGQYTQTPKYQAQNNYQESQRGHCGKSPWLIGILLAVFFVIIGGGIIYAANNISKPSLDKSTTITQVPSTSSMPTSTPAKPSTSTTPLPNPNANSIAEPKTSTPIAPKSEISIYDYYVLKQDSNNWFICGKVKNTGETIVYPIEIPICIEIEDGINGEKHIRNMSTPGIDKKEVPLNPGEVRDFRILIVTYFNKYSIIPGAGYNMNIKFVVL